MDDRVKNIVEECTLGSDEGRLTFPQVIEKLTDVGVERYFADLQRAAKTYYMPNGESHVVVGAPIKEKPAQNFFAPDVEVAVRAIQGRRSTYKDFCEEIAAAGCVGYLVSLAGRRVVYFGRSGESHEEPFPIAK